MRIRLLLALALTSSLVLSACDDGGNRDGGDATGSGSASGTHTGSASGTHTGSGSASGSGTGAAPVELDGEVQDHGTEQLDGTELELEAEDFYFAPTYIQADPGAQVEVTIVNEGDAPHTFTIDEAEIDVEVGAGAEGSATVTVPDDGALAFYCRFHLQQGMQGAFFTG